MTISFINTYIETVIAGKRKTGQKKKSWLNTGGV